MWPYHLSARVPWHDNGWVGTVCNKPQHNASCTVLKNIQENRQVDEEVPLAGESFDDIGVDDLPPCVSEGVGFMADDPIVTQHDHPYQFLWENLETTTLRSPPYSVNAVPFERMLKDNAEDIGRDWDLDVELAREPKETRNNDWVNNPENQEALLDGFFDVLKEDQSLVFLYAKKTPLFEEKKPVLIGVGWVKDIPPVQEYEGSHRGMRQLLWERPITHSIRPDFSEGFVMPYAEILEACDEKDIDPGRFAAQVPSATGTDFLYRAGLVNTDSALAALMSLRDALKLTDEELDLDGPWEQVLSWLEDRIENCWFDRGPCPGLRGVLGAAGVDGAAAASLELHHLADGEDPWPLLADACDGKAASDRLERYFSGMSGMRLQRIIEDNGEQYELYRLLSRFALSGDQVEAWLNQNGATDALENPYQLYLKTRRMEEPISLQTIERTIYGEKPKSGHEIGLPSEWQNPPYDKPERLEAIAVATLEEAKEEGHTWLPEEAIISKSKELIDHHPPSMKSGDMEILTEISENLQNVQDIGFQLDYLAQAEAVIRKDVTERVSQSIPQPIFDAEKAINEAIGEPIQGDRDEQARQEKAKALNILTEGSISSLDGPAGCGKTTVVKALADVLGEEGSVLCLAPTGKARVQIERSFEDFQEPRPEFRTIHSFLLTQERYDYDSGTVNFTEDGLVSDEYGTVIIDEASMLNTEMLAALCAAISNSTRLILVGDPRQLPPIGPGRPFVDILEFLREQEHGAAAQLHTIMRDSPDEESAFRFARLFDTEEDAVDDAVWNWPNRECVGNINFDYWSEQDDLYKKIHEWINARLPDSSDKGKAFDEWLGAQPWKDTHFFNRGSGVEADSWQILSPRRTGPGGTDEINMEVKNEYRNHWLQQATHRYNKIPQPLGDMQVTYGDKVICNNNQRKDGKEVYDPDGKALEYVANGEIGVAIGPRKTKKISKDQWKSLKNFVEVEFSSQTNVKYSFSVQQEDALELAYALTTHRAQGSQFDETLVVVPKSYFVGPEMLYTALTRSSGSVTLLIEEDEQTLLNASNPRRSKVGGRLTNLFTPSEADSGEDSWFDAGKIHRTTNEIYVRSKSELVIANLLHERNIPFEYEEVLERNGEVRRPDFTIRTSDRTYYWEHLGMLTRPDYAEEWEKKKEWYATHGITEDSEEERLVVSKDDPDGSLDAQKIQSQIDRISSRL